MLLSFGEKTVDTTGLPRIAVISSYSLSDGTTCVMVLLASRARAAVEKWAKRLGVDVVEDAGGCGWDSKVSAEAESDGYRLHVYTFTPATAASAAGGAQ